MANLAILFEARLLYQINVLFNLLPVSLVKQLVLLSQFLFVCNRLPDGVFLRQELQCFLLPNVESLQDWIGVPHECHHAIDHFDAYLLLVQLLGLRELLVKMLTNLAQRLKRLLIHYFTLHGVSILGLSGVFPYQESFRDSSLANLLKESKKRSFLRCTDRLSQYLLPFPESSHEHQSVERGVD